MTHYYNWKENINKEELKQCCKILKENGTIVMPTETVYGIAANALSEEAVRNIYQAKGRELDNPLIVHVSDKKMIQEVVKEVSEIEEKIIDAFMPGPCTLILKKQNKIPNIVSANLPTVGIRMPSHPIAHILIQTSGYPLAAPSANISGRPSGTRVEDIREELDGKVSAFIDGGISDIGVESTVIKVIDGVPTILRPGAITPEMIKDKIGCIAINKKVFEKVQKGEKVESPGMKYRHYAPKTPCICVYSKEEEKQIRKIKELIEKGKRQNQKICVLGFSEHKDKILAEYYISLGSKQHLEEISKNIFMELRQADKLGVDLILIEGVEKEGIGLAIMNRLIRTCEYHIYDLDKIEK